MRRVQGFGFAHAGEIRKLTRASQGLTFSLGVALHSTVETR